MGGETFYAEAPRETIYWQRYDLSIRLENGQINERAVGESKPTPVKCIPIELENLAHIKNVTQLIPVAAYMATKMLQTLEACSGYGDITPSKILGMQLAVAQKHRIYERVICPEPEVHRRAVQFPPFAARCDGRHAECHIVLAFEKPLFA